MRTVWDSNAHIFDVKRFAIHDGPGIRTTVFFRGCPLTCDWCQNPECMQEIPDNSTDDDAVQTVQQTMPIIERDSVYYQQSGGGVTFSGGEPLGNPPLLESFLNACHQKGYHTALDTSGFASPDTLEHFAAMSDLFLYDLKLTDEAAHIRHTGVTNKPILENLQWLADTGIPIIIRVPLIPCVTDTRQNLRDISDFLLKLGHELPVELLPFNTLAKAKYSRLGQPSRYDGVPVQTEEELAESRRVFLESGIKLLGVN